MSFQVDSQFGPKALSHSIQSGMHILKAAVVLAIMLLATTASAEKLKLAVFPVNDSMGLKPAQQEYLYDVIREAASASAGSYIALIHEQKINSVVKKNKGGCDEECALKGASSVDARVAIVVELHPHGNQVLGIVKLLDVQESVLLTVKRFFSESLQTAEQELQVAVMFVLSAQFLPLNDSDRQALQMEQQNIPVNYARPGQTGNDYQAGPSTPVQPAPVQPSPSNEPAVAPQPEYTYSNTDIAQPAEPVNPKAYLVTAIVTGALGVGFGVLTGVSASQLKKEVSKKDQETADKNALVTDYNYVLDNPDDPSAEGAFNNRYWTKYGLDEQSFSFSSPDTVQNIVNIHSSNINRINKKITSNGILTGVFGGLTLASLIVSATFSVKYVKASRNPQASSTHRLHMAPVFSREMNGAVLSATF